MPAVNMSVAGFLTVCIPFFSQFIDIVAPSAQIVSEARGTIIFGNLPTGTEEFIATSE